MEDMELVDFCPDDDTMHEDELAGRARALAVPRIIAGAGAGAVPVSIRGRGSFLGQIPSVLASSRGRSGSLAAVRTFSLGPGPGPQRSVEGWIILVTGVKDDAEEDDLYDAFSEFGDVKSFHFNIESHTGYRKGYAFIEYGNFDEAQAAIKVLNGAHLFTKTIYVDWAFSEGPLKQLHGRSSRQRSRSPPRRLT